VKKKVINAKLDGHWPHSLSPQEGDVEPIQTQP